jgi:hypothetical protein
LGSGSPKLAQRGGANTLDTGSAAAAADGVDGAAVAEGGGEAKRSEGGDLNANDKGVDGESSSGKRVREEEKSGVENESKNSNLIQSSQPRRRVSCLRHGKAHRPNIDTTQLERHRRAVWSASEVHILEEGLATYISPRIPKGDAATRMDKWSDENGTRIRASTDPHSVDEPTWRVAHGANKQRIEWLLTGDERCRRSLALTERKACLVKGNDAGGWAHYDGAGETEESTTPTYSQKCPTALGKGNPRVKDKELADAVEDAIELYVTDMAYRRRLVADDSTSDLEEARMFKAHEEISHGHFRKWRRAMEKHYKEKGIGQPFWCATLGDADRMKSHWNFALRQSQSFAVCDKGTDTPTQVRFDRYLERERRKVENELEQTRVHRLSERRQAPSGEWKISMTPEQEARLSRLRKESNSLRTVVCTDQVQLHMMASTENAQIPRWAEEVKSASYRVERAGRNRGAEDHAHSDAAAGSLAHMEALRREASGHDEQRRKSLAENLLNTVELANCEFVADHNEFGRLKAAHAPKDGDVVVEDTAKWPGLQAHMHADGHGATFTVDQRVNTWLTRGGRSATIRHVSSDRSGRLGRRADPQRAGSTRTVPRARAGASGEATNLCAQVNSQAPVVYGKDIGPEEPKPSKNDDKMDETPSKDNMPEFMTTEMREKISKTVLTEGREERVKELLEASETACDDQHQFNPSRFDMEHAMRINLKKDCEPPPPEFRKQGHHMLEIIAAQIKEMEDAGWVYRGKSTTACPLHVVRKPTAPGEKQKWRITCDYRELNKVIQNHAYPLPEVTETIRALREQACESHRQDLENGVENPDIPAHVDKRGQIVFYCIVIP